MTGWLQHQDVPRLRLDTPARVHEREILAIPPERQQVRIMRTLRLCRLAGNVDGHRVVEIPEIDDLAVRRTSGFTEVGAARRHYRVRVTAPRERCEIESRSDRVLEFHDVQHPPRHLVLVRTESALQRSDGTVEGRRGERVPASTSA